LAVWQRGKSIDMVRNPRYHGGYGGNVQKVRLDFAELQDAWRRFTAGELDVMDITYAPPVEITRMRQRFPGQYLAVPQLFTCYVGFVITRPPFDNSRVRRALVQAADRETLAHAVLQGYGSPALGGFIPPAMPGHSPRIGLAYDLERARRLLSEAGYAGGARFPPVELMIQADPMSAVGSDFLREQWHENLGIEVAPQVVEFQHYVERLAHDPPHAFIWGWAADYPDPDNFLRVCNARTDTRWRNEAYTALVQKASRVLDQEERIRLYREAGRILIEGAAVVPLLYLDQHWMVKPWVIKYPVSPFKSFFWKDVIIEPH
jgi:oligopeptide transport system substrate-binding protein